MASTELRVTVRVAWWARALPPIAAVAGFLAPVLPRWAVGLFLRGFFAALRRGVRAEA